MTDRRVHASLADGSFVVRYDRAGKWFHEWPNKWMRSRRLTLQEAVDLATEPGARVNLGLSGGLSFDRKVERKLGA